MKPAKEKYLLDERIILLLQQSTNETNTAFTIARIIENNDDRKAGSMHLAVKLAARRLEQAGRICIWLPPGADRWESYHYGLSNVSDWHIRKGSCDE